MAWVPWNMYARDVVAGIGPAEVFLLKASSRLETRNVVHLSSVPGYDNRISYPVLLRVDKSLMDVRTKLMRSRGEAWPGLLDNAPPLSV